MHHLESCLEATPAAYIQRRFADGIDKELANLSMMKLTPEEEVLRNKKGNVYSIVDRVLKGKMMQCATPTPRPFPQSPAIPQTHAASGRAPPEVLMTKLLSLSEPSCG